MSCKCFVQPFIFQADLLMEAADQLLSDALQLRRSFIDDILAPSVGPRMHDTTTTAAGVALATAAHAVAPRAAAAAAAATGERRSAHVEGAAGAAAAVAAVLSEAAEVAGADGLAEPLDPRDLASVGKGSSFLLDIPLFELLVFCCLPTLKAGQAPRAAAAPGSTYRCAIAACC